MSFPDWFWELPLAIVAAVTAIVATVWFQRHLDRRMDGKIDEHRKQDHAVDGAKWDGLDKRIDTILLSVHDVGQGVKAVHKRLDDHIDAPRRDRAES